MTISQEDRKALKKQLGREPRGVIGVSRHAPDGTPLVIKTSPFIISQPRTPNSELTFEPFPTIYYLTHPETVKNISRLEDKGLINKLELKIGTDEVLARQFREAQQSYIDERKELIKNTMGITGNQKKDIMTAADSRPQHPFGRSLRRVLSCTSTANLHPQFLRQIINSGIGGVADLTKIKCLHAHYAYYLASGRDPVGKVVEEELNLEKGGN